MTTKDRGITNKTDIESGSSEDRHTLLCKADYKDCEPSFVESGEEPALHCEGEFDEVVKSGRRKNAPSFFVFSRLPHSPLDWRMTLVYSYLCFRIRFNRGAGLRDIEAATGISRTTLTTLKSEARRRKLGLMRKLIDAGLIKLDDKHYYALDPPEDAAKSLFYDRKGEIEHWTDRWAYFPFTKEPNWTTPVSLVYCKLLSMKTHSVTERGLAKLLGMSRDAVGNAFDKLIKLHKIVGHPVPDEACSFFLIVRDYSLDDEPDVPETAIDKEEERTQIEAVTGAEKPTLRRYQEFVQFCKESYKFPDHVIPQLYEFEQGVGCDRFNEILRSSNKDHQRKKKLDPDKYYGPCHSLLVHRLRRELSEE
jgi:hypothetical protein